MTKGESTKEDKDEECDDDLLAKKELTKTTLSETTKIHATAFDQSFESILHVEQECIEIGFQSGQSDGEAKGLKEGESIGFLEAFAIGSEVGHYLGALRVWEREFSSPSPDGTTTTTNLEERKKERIRMALGQLETALGDIVASGWIGDDKDGTTKEGTDTNLDEDFTEKLERARACFRKCTASLGVHGKYKGFAGGVQAAEDEGDNSCA